MEKGKAQFPKDLHQWYAVNKRDLPWRGTTDPYRILVSEVMLQQTQVDRVVPKYEIFLESFPTVSALATASPARVIAVWQGLGYNRRALNLHKAAKKIMEAGGVFPKELKELQEIPGVGLYTASAVASFAFNEDTAVVDTNVVRVLARLFVGKKALSETISRKTLDRLALEILPQGSSCLHNNAMMEFGALVCRAQPACRSCFASSYCVAFQEKRRGLLADVQLSMLGTPQGGFGTVQSRFEGSDRQLRGRIVSVLALRRPVSFHFLHAAVEKRMGVQVAKTRCQKLLAQLVKEGMIQKEGDAFSLPQR